LLGICLGHQALAQSFGGKIVRAPKIMHGKLSSIRHTGKGLFKGIPCPLPVVRYHSLIVEKETLPKCLEITSETEEGVVMGIRHKRYPIEGFQFHPESIMTDFGKKLLINFFKKVYKA
jgi:para-aminobenzoate synthetase component 2